MISKNEAYKEICKIMDAPIPPCDKKQLVYNVLDKYAKEAAGRVS